MGLLNATGSWTGAAYGSTANFNAGQWGEADVPDSDPGILRELAAQVAEEAALPAQREKRELWRRHNDLEATRPVVLCDPENGWNEIITDRRPRLCEARSRGAGRWCCAKSCSGRAR